MKDKPEIKKPEIKLTEQELKTLSNLLFTGKWGLSIEENNRVIVPLINKLALLLDQFKK